MTGSYVAPIWHDQKPAWVARSEVRLTRSGQLRDSSLVSACSDGNLHLQLESSASTLTSPSSPTTSQVALLTGLNSSLPVDPASSLSSNFDASRADIPVDVQVDAPKGGNRRSERVNVTTSIGLDAPSVDISLDVPASAGVGDNQPVEPPGMSTSASTTHLMWMFMELLTPALVVISEKSMMR